MTKDNFATGGDQRSNHRRDQGRSGNVLRARPTEGDRNRRMHGPYPKIDPIQDVMHQGVATYTQKDKDSRDFGERAS